jgi:hypothetical protein
MKRACFGASILLAIVALSFHSVARDKILSAAHLKAERISAAQKQQIAYTPDLAAVSLSRSGHTLNKTGLVFTFLSFACMIVAAIRHESGWYSVPTMLLLADVLVMMLL